jgi:hypothetical protein
MKMNFLISHNFYQKNYYYKLDHIFHKNNWQILFPQNLFKTLYNLYFRFLLYFKNFLFSLYLF